MDLAYDAITQSSYTDRAVTPTPTPKPPETEENTSSTSTDPSEPDPQATPKSAPRRENLQTEFQESFKAFSATPWGAKLGGWWTSTTKQGQSYYEEAVKEAEDLRVDALKGWGDLKEAVVMGSGRARGLSGGEGTIGKPEEGKGEGEGPSEDEKKMQETETFLDKFKAEAAKRLKDVQAAEDAADEALLRFGTNIRSFLRDAVVITEPDDDQQPGEVLFESKDKSGKRVVHASRLDGQLYVIHTTPTRFTKDPEDEGGQWTQFKKDFDIEKQTETVARDLERYPELRQTMEELAEKVEYKEFWTRYYFLRMVLEAQEERRRKLLKASTNETEEIGWDEDSSDDDDEDENKPSSTPRLKEVQQQKLVSQNTNDSSLTVNQPNNGGGGLKPEGRRSHDEKSVADSEASYDIVSGAPSRAASSPKEKKVDESDEEDWE